MFRLRTLLALFMCCALTVANAQPANHNHPASDVKLHNDFYSKWNKPNSQQSCCNQQDCYPTQAYFDVQQGLWFAMIRETGRYQVIPARVYDPQNPPITTTPDGHAHVCAVPDTTNVGSLATIHCFVPPDTKI